MNTEPRRRQAAPQNRDRIEDDHAYIRQVMTWLKSAREEEAMAVLLADFQPYLLAHFDAEEASGGLFHELLGRAPRYQHLIDELKDEHRGLALRAARVADEIHEPYGKASDVLLANVADLVASIERHERREQGVMQEAFDRDIAAGD